MSPEYNAKVYLVVSLQFFVSITPRSTLICSVSNYLSPVYK